MPSLTITVTAAQWARVQAALELSTAAEAEAWVLARVKEAVRDAEAAEAHHTTQQAVENEDWSA